MRIMVVDDNKNSLQSLCLVLEDLGHEPVPFANPSSALAASGKEFFPLIITDIRMPDMNGLELLWRIKALPFSTPSDVVIITGHGDMQTAVEALRKGAYDYLNKPINAKELAAVVERCAEHQALRLENLELKNHMREKVAEATHDMAKRLEEAHHLLREVAGIGQMVAESPAMRRLVDEALIMHSNPGVSVLIEGETGTGKEVLAKLIHHGNNASDTPFIGINCAAIPAELFESELFGHDPGAYTGSRSSGAPGKLEAAGGGTIFLDEVAELPLALQPKLLRALEERAFYRLGGVKRRSFEARVICAANRDLAGMVEQELFRRDLYHRLQVGHLRIPPLRERKEDIAVLVELILRREAEHKKKHFRAFSPEAMTLLLHYPWPGNVRELENTLERAVLMYDGEEITPLHLNFLTQAPWPQNAVSGLPSETPDWFASAAGSHLTLPEQPFNLEELNNSIVLAAMTRFSGNKSKAASYLGLSRFALHRRLQAKKKD